jgi:hypothetical protein
MPYLKNETDMAEFVRRVQDCRADVFFVSEAGDRLNLRSELSKYLFVTASARGLLSNGTIECENGEDYAVLRDFLTEEK